VPVVGNRKVTFYIRVITYLDRRPELAVIEFRFTVFEAGGRAGGCGHKQQSACFQEGVEASSIRSFIACPGHEYEVGISLGLPPNSFRSTKHFLPPGPYLIFMFYLSTYI
jgi:hypothetical protein